MDYEAINYEVEDNILIITLNRPEKLNALNGTMSSEILDALDRADNDDNVKAIIFTGKGRAFCAGADLSGGNTTFDYDSDGRGIHPDGGGVLTLRIFECMKPVISACNGPCGEFGSTCRSCYLRRTRGAGATAPGQQGSQHRTTTLRLIACGVILGQSASMRRTCAFSGTPEQDGTRPIWPKRTGA